MPASCRILMSRLLVSAALLFTVSTAGAQRGEGRGEPRIEARGLVKAVDVKAGTISVTAAEGRQEPVEKTYTLAKEVEVVLGDFSSSRRGMFKAAKLESLIAGTTVNLSLSADKKTVESIVAEEPMVRGIIKDVDVNKKTVTLTLFPNRRDQEAEDKTFTLSGDAEVGVDDGKGRRFSVKEGKLSDLVAGASVSGRLSLDQKELTFVIAEGPTYFGSVKSIDAAKNSVTLQTQPGRGGEAEEKTIEVAKDAQTLLNDGKGRRLSLKEGKLAEVPVGAAIQMRMSHDGKHATMLRVEGPNVPALIKAIDAKKGTIIVVTRMGREEGEEKTYSVAKDVRVFMGGKEGKLDDIKLMDNGSFSTLRLTLDQKTVQIVTVHQPRE